MNSTTNHTGSPYIPYIPDSVTNNQYQNEIYNPIYQNETSSNETVELPSQMIEANTEYNISGYKSMRIKHISHLDLDGYSSTILTEILKYFLPEGYYDIEVDNILPNKLNTIMKEVIENIDYWDRIVITDLAINQELLEMIRNAKDSEKIRVFDHHKCELTDLPDNVVVTKYSPIHEGKLTCATELYFNFLKTDPIFDFIKIRGNDKFLEYFVECVRVYDTFEFWKTRNDSENEKYMHYVDAPRLNTLFHILEREDFKKYIYQYLIDGHNIYDLTRYNSTCPYVQEILNLEANKNMRYVEAALRRLIKTDFVCDVWKDNKLHKLNHHIGVVFAEKNGPIIGNTACENNPELDLCAVVSNNQVSLYTNKENVDVSSIAKLFGGGGHEEAAGLTIPYINANVYSMNHFFDIIECAGRITAGTAYHQKIQFSSDGVVWDTIYNRGYRE